MKAVIFTLGCKVNRYESDLIAQELSERGYSVTDELSVADIYILNTCAVTAEAEKKSRQAITRCRKFNDKAKIFVLGCASQHDPDAFNRDNVVYISGTNAKNTVLDYLNQDTRIHMTIDDEIAEEKILYTPSRTRSFVKIQDGCNNFCTYCLIPYLRGRSRSRSIDSIVEEINILATKTPEIVLTGINTMAFGSDNGQSLIDLFNAIKDVNVRIRMSSFYAEGITNELLDKLFLLKKFCPHFHLSLQSGDKDVLKKMNRRYTPEIYEEKIDLIRSYDPNAAITTDIIVGFPSETENNFMNTFEFCRKVKFSDLHIFPFSAREGTVAYSMPKIDNSIINEREKKLFELKKELHTSFLLQNIGIEQEVLIEERRGEYNVGYSRNYTKIYTDKSGEIVTIKPEQIFSDGLK